MKNFILILMIVLVTACGKGGGAGGSSTPAAVINPELYGRNWQTTYSVGPNLFADHLQAQDDEAVIETYLTGALVGTVTWTLRPLTETTMQVSDGIDTFTVEYEINGNVMDICYENGTCSTFMY